jgi:hypothetical protein
MTSLESPPPSFDSICDAFRYYHQNDGISISTLFGLISNHDMNVLVTATTMLIDRYQDTIDFAQLKKDSEEVQRRNINGGGEHVDKNAKNNHNFNTIRPGTYFDDIASIEFLGINSGKLPLNSSYYLPYLALATSDGDLIHFVGLLRSRSHWNTGLEFRLAWERSDYHQYKENFGNKNPHLPAERWIDFYFLKAIEFVFMPNNSQISHTTQTSHQEYIYHWLGVDIYDFVPFLFNLGLTNLEYTASFFSIISNILKKTILTANYALLSTFLSADQFGRVRYVVDSNVIRKQQFENDFFKNNSSKSDLPSPMNARLLNVMAHPDPLNTLPQREGVQNMLKSNFNNNNLGHFYDNSEPYFDPTTTYIDLFSLMPSYAQPTIKLNLDPFDTEHGGSIVMNIYNAKNAKNYQPHNRTPPPYIMPEFVYIELKSVHPLLSLLWAHTYELDNGIDIPTKFGHLETSLPMPTQPTHLSKPPQSPPKQIDTQLGLIKSLRDAYGTHKASFLAFFNAFFGKALCVAIEISTPTHDISFNPLRSDALNQYVNVLGRTMMKLRFIDPEFKREYFSHNASNLQQNSVNSPKSALKSKQNWQKLWLIEDYCILYHFSTSVIFNHNAAVVQFAKSAQKKNQQINPKTSNLSQNGLDAYRIALPYGKNDARDDNNEVKNGDGVKKDVKKDFIYNKNDIQGDIDVYYDIIDQLHNIGMNSNNWMVYDPDWADDVDFGGLDGGSVKIENEGEDQSVGAHNSNNNNNNNNADDILSSTSSLDSLPALEIVETDSVQSDENNSDHTLTRLNNDKFLPLPPVSNPLYFIHPILPTVIEKELHIFQQKQYLSLPLFTRDRYRLLLTMYIQHNLLPHVDYLINYTIPVIYPEIIQANMNKSDQNGLTKLQNNQQINRTESPLTQHHHSLSNHSMKPQGERFIPYPGFLNDILGSNTTIFSTVLATNYSSVLTLKFLIQRKIPIRFRQADENTKSSGKMPQKNNPIGQKTLQNAPTNRYINVLHNILLDSSHGCSIYACVEALKGQKGVGVDSADQKTLSTPPTSNLPVTLQSISSIASNKLAIIDYFEGFLNRNLNYNAKLNIVEFFHLISSKNTRFWSFWSQTSDIIEHIDILRVVEGIIMKQRGGNDEKSGKKQVVENRNNNQNNQNNKNNQNNQNFDPNFELHIPFCEAITNLSDHYLEDITPILDMLITSLDLHLLSPNIVEISSKKHNFDLVESCRKKWLKMSPFQQKSYKNFISYILYLFFHPSNLPLFISTTPKLQEHFYAHLFAHPYWAVISQSLLITRNFDAFLGFIQIGYKPLQSDFFALMYSNRWFYDVNDINIASLMHGVFFAQVSLRDGVVKDGEEIGEIGEAIEFFKDMVRKNGEKSKNNNSHNSQLESYTIQGGFEPILSPFWLKTISTLNDKIKYDNLQYLIEIWNSPLGTVFNETIQKLQRIKEKLEFFLKHKWHKYLITKYFIKKLKNNLEVEMTDYKVNLDLVRNGHFGGDRDQDDQNIPNLGDIVTDGDSNPSSIDAPLDQVNNDMGNNDRILKHLKTPFFYRNGKNKYQRPKFPKKPIIILTKSQTKERQHLIFQTYTALISSILQMKLPTDAFNRFDPVLITGLGIGINMTAKNIKNSKKFPMLSLEDFFILDKKLINFKSPQELHELREVEKNKKGAAQILVPSDAEHLIGIQNDGGSLVTYVPPRVDEDVGDECDQKENQDGGIETVETVETIETIETIEKRISTEDENLIQEALIELFNPVQTSNDTQYLMNNHYLRSLDLFYSYQRQNDNNNDTKSYKKTNTFLDFFYLLFFPLGPEFGSFFLSQFFQSLPFNSSNYLCYLLWVYLYPQNSLTHMLQYVPLLALSGGSTYQEHFLLKLNQRLIIDSILSRLYTSPVLMATITDVKSGGVIGTDDKGLDGDSSACMTPCDINKTKSIKTLFVNHQQLQRTVSYLLMACFDIIQTTTTKALLPQTEFDPTRVGQDIDKTIIGTTQRPWFSPVRITLKSASGGKIGSRTSPHTILLDNIAIIVDILKYSSKYCDEFIQNNGVKYKEHFGGLFMNVMIGFSTIIDVILRTRHHSPTIIPNLLHLLIMHGYSLPNDIYPIYQVSSGSVGKKENNGIFVDNFTNKSPYWWVKSAPVNAYNMSTMSFHSKTHGYIMILLSIMMNKNQQKLSLSSGLYSSVGLNNSFISTFLRNSQDDRFFIKERLYLVLASLLTVPKINHHNTDLSRAETPKDDSTNGTDSVVESGGQSSSNLAKEAGNTQMKGLHRGKNIYKLIEDRTVSLLGETIWMSLAGTYQPRLLNLLLTVLMGYFQQLKSKLKREKGPNISSLDLSTLLSSDLLERTVLHHFISKPILGNRCVDIQQQYEVQTSNILRFLSTKFNLNANYEKNSHFSQHNKYKFFSAQCKDFDELIPYDDEDKNYENSIFQVLNYQTHGFETHSALLTPIHHQSIFSQLPSHLYHTYSTSLDNSRHFTPTVQSLLDISFLPPHTISKLGKSVDIPSNIHPYHSQHPINWSVSHRSRFIMDIEEQEMINNDRQSMYIRRSVGLPSYIDELGKGELDNGIIDGGGNGNSKGGQIFVLFDVNSSSKETLLDESLPQNKFFATAGVLMQVNLLDCDESIPSTQSSKENLNKPEPPGIKSDLTQVAVQANLDVEESQVLSQLLTFIRQGFYDRFDELSEIIEKTPHIESNLDQIGVHVVKNEGIWSWIDKYTPIHQYHPKKSDGFYNSYFVPQNDYLSDQSDDKEINIQDLNSKFFAKVLNDDVLNENKQQELTHLYESLVQRNFLNLSTQDNYSKIYLSELQQLLASNDATNVIESDDEDVD